MDEDEELLHDAGLIEQQVSCIRNNPNKTEP